MNIAYNECWRQKENLEALNEALREALRTHQNQNQVQCIIDSVLNKHKELLSQHSQYRRIKQDEQANNINVLQ